MSVPSRAEIHPGSRVWIVEKQNQPTGKLTEGIVSRILTSSPNHPHGIKVMLTDGKVGRVQALAVPGAEGSAASPPPAKPAELHVVRQAKRDLSRRLSVSIEQIELVEMTSVTWPDSSLGCPQPGMAYAQVLVEGVRLRLRAGGREYEYHSAGSQNPFLCE